MIKSKNPVYWLLKIKNPTHQIDENLGLNPGWVFWFSSLPLVTAGDPSFLNSLDITVLRLIHFNEINKNKFSILYIF